MTPVNADTAFELGRTLPALTLDARLVRIAAIAHRAVMTTSLGVEDQVLTAAIAGAARGIHLATLDTGRLFPETEALLAETRVRYGLDIVAYRPRAEDVEDFTARYGVDGFYGSREARHACCHARKLVPLARALKGADVWVTGLRRDQSGARASTPFAEWDGERGLLKVNPLADWSGEDVRAYVAAHDVPVNPLHARGYPSIGCEPCTRAVKPGESERAGRWWWERDDTRECGLHVAAKVPAYASS
ncbi:phosphoadenylyl-sulfate reductase [Pararhizobium mangrovi]|uniref:Adenosine 5'-phosphosulfate reductase n=1 Tax=Pararhizobium mangrovi TaxID=2590452 RepID=A0A506U3G2_9HYPH|nr:phosphoadenylyl-sulfate reductase [Pararhizobium mangrovi]TPW27574.1 phosphoadenylyl-sulfate reductase [Pararhizobium mangrovi]